MEICSDGHDEIAHNERKCPLCENIKQTDSKIEELQETISQLEDDAP